MQKKIPRHDRNLRASTKLLSYILILCLSSALLPNKFATNHITWNITCRHKCVSCINVHRVNTQPLPFTCVCPLGGVRFGRGSDEFQGCCCYRAVSRLSVKRIWIHKGHLMLINSAVASFRTLYSPLARGWWWTCLLQEIISFCVNSSDSHFLIPGFCLISCFHAFFFFFFSFSLFSFSGSCNCCCCCCSSSVFSGLFSTHWSHIDTQYMCVCAHKWDLSTISTLYKFCQAYFWKRCIDVISAIACGEVYKCKVRNGSLQHIDTFNKHFYFKWCWLTILPNHTNSAWLNCMRTQPCVCSQNTCQVSECIVSSTPPWQPPSGDTGIKVPHSPMPRLISLPRKDGVLMKGRFLS